MLQLKEKVLGEEHPSMLISMDNLASVLQSQAKYEEAEGMHRQTLQLTGSCVYGFVGTFITSYVSSPMVRMLRNSSSSISWHDHHSSLVTYIIQRVHCSA
jgi:hypothetical protein